MKSYTPGVLEVIAQRHIMHSLGNKREDPYKIALIVEGGAMRSIVSAGMLLALRDIKMLHCFDVYIGSSGGSLNLAYLLAEQGDIGLSIFYRHIINQNVIDLSAALTGSDTLIKMKALESILSS